MFTVYVIKSKSGLIYIGQTNDLKRRLQQHQKGQSKYTKRDTGWRLVHSEIYESRAEAMKREKWLKSSAGRTWLHDLLDS